MISIRNANFLNDPSGATLRATGQEHPMNALDIPAMPAQPIGGSFAWTEAQVRQRDDWNCRLDAADVAAIETATRSTRTQGLTIQEIERDDFPLGPLTTRLGALRAQIRSGLGFGYIKGLPVERYDRETLVRIYWGLCRHVGDPEIGRA